MSLLTYEITHVVHFVSRPYSLIERIVSIFQHYECTGPSNVGIFFRPQNRVERVSLHGTTRCGPVGLPKDLATCGRHELLPTVSQYPAAAALSTTYCAAVFYRFLEHSTTSFSPPGRRPAERWRSEGCDKPSAFHLSTELAGCCTCLSSHCSRTGQIQNGWQRRSAPVSVPLYNALRFCGPFYLRRFRFRHVAVNVL